MKHTWERKEDETNFGVKHKEWKCKVCGATKSLGYYKFAVPLYQRNGQSYGDDYIECIDYDAEDLKTID